MIGLSILGLLLLTMVVFLGMVVIKSGDYLLYAVFTFFFLFIGALVLVYLGI